HDHHTGGLALGLLEVVGGEDDGAPGGGDAAHLVPEGAPGADVHADGGLVQQQHLRVAEQGDGEADRCAWPPERAPIFRFTRSAMSAWAMTSAIGMGWACSEWSIRSIERTDWSGSSAPAWS